MNWKEFLKPNWKKIIMLVVFLVFFSFAGSRYPFWSALCDPCGCFNNLGYPLSFYEESAIGAEFGLDRFSCGTRVTNYNVGFLVFDIFVWYLISCLIVWAYFKIREKK